MNKLNKEQLEAINFGTGPLLIIAGAGTGKTTVITERIKHLILDKKIAPQEILALTFTEKGATEMQTRVDQAMPYGYFDMWIMTFHSFCDRVLRESAIHIGLNPKYKVLTQVELVNFIKLHLFKFDLDYFRPLNNPTKFITALLDHFSRLQDEVVSPQEYLTYANIYAKKAKADEEKMEAKEILELANAYQKYEDLKTQESYFDFGDLITKTIDLFKKRPNIRKKYSDQFKYLLIDEFQDTNYAQSELAYLLVNSDANINVVGDDDQAIYRFRGAAISNILQFRKKYPTAHALVLNKNYRSGQNILDSAYKLIQNNNPDRLEVAENIDKKLLSQVKYKGKVDLIHTITSQEEVEEVAKKIHLLVTNPKSSISYGDVAILVRANSHADPFIKEFESQALPYQFLGPSKLFREKEIIDLISYLKILLNPDDSLSFYRVLSLDKLEIEIKDLLKLSNFSKRKNLTLLEASENLSEIQISEKSKEKITTLIQTLNTDIKKITIKTGGQILFDFLEKIGLLSELFTPQNEVSQLRALKITKLLEKIKNYENNNPSSDLASLLSWIDLQIEAGENSTLQNSDWDKENKINILTVHGSKGLEFKVVFLVNLVSLRFPTTERGETLPIPNEFIKETLPTGNYHLEEERRLFYVGMTRAKEYLFLTGADYYSDTIRPKKLSPFVFETLDKITATKEKQSTTKELHIPKPETIHSKPLVNINYLSYSQIETFKLCPLHYYLRYILNVPTKPSSSQSFGISLHNTLKDFYASLNQGEKAHKDTLFNYLAADWVNDGYLDKDHEKKSLEKAQVFLSDFYDKEVRLDNLPLLLEQPFTIPLNKDLKIGGKIDRLDHLSDGRVEIIDYKTGGKVPTQKEADENMQLTFYALAATLIKDTPFNRKPSEVLLSLYYFEEQKKITTTRTQEDLDTALTQILEIKKEIETSDFTCSNNFLCQNCEYGLFCKEGK